MSASPNLRLVPAAQADNVARSLPGALAARVDEELMVAAGAGSRDAFAVLVERYVVKVASYCIKFTRDQRTGEDLAQDIFLQLWAHRSTYKPSHKFNVFLFTAVVNRCRNHNRSWWRRGRHEVEGASDTDAASIEVTQGTQLDELLLRERRRGVQQAIGTLPEKLREVLLLRYEQELDYADIARLVNCPEATVRSRAFHGLKKVRACLQGDLP